MKVYFITWACKIVFWNSTWNGCTCACEGWHLCNQDKLCSFFFFIICHSYVHHFFWNDSRSEECLNKSNKQSLPLYADHSCLYTLPMKKGKCSVSKTDCDIFTAKSRWEEDLYYSSHSQILIIIKELIKAMRTVSGDGTKTTTWKRSFNVWDITIVASHSTFTVNALQLYVYSKANIPSNISYYE